MAPFDSATKYLEKGRQMTATDHTNPATPGSLNIVNGQVWRGADRGFVPQDVFITEGLVSETPAPGATVVDAAGKWVVPGLVDAHFHAYATSQDGLENERGPLSYAAINGARRLTKALKRGFTAVRDVAGGDIGLAHAIKEGIFPSPRYWYTGPALSQTGGHGDPRAAHIDVCFSHGHMCEVVDGVDDLRLAARNRLRTGAHAIKMMTSGGVFSLADPLPIPQYSDEEIRAVVDEAHRRGSYVASHSYSVESVMHSITNGIRSIEHGNLIDSATAQAMAARDAYLVPTLAAYDAMDRRGASIGLNEISLAKNQIVLSKGQEAIQLAHAAGVSVGFGSDLMGELEDDQLRGVALQIQASGTTATLQSMTETNALLLNIPQLGHLGIGAFGDALVLEGDPIADPDVLPEASTRYAVVQRGTCWTTG
jgi:imidazolonepropionase-like amidohydrolase